MAELSAARLSLKRGLLERLRSVLKWFVTEARAEAAQTMLKTEEILAALDQAGVA